jgi:hypothetical protein
LLARLLPVSVAAIAASAAASAPPASALFATFILAAGVLALSLRLRRAGNFLRFVLAVFLDKVRVMFDPVLVAARFMQRRMLLAFAAPTPSAPSAPSAPATARLPAFAGRGAFRRCALFGFFFELAVALYFFHFLDHWRDRIRRNA